jgi:tRNA G18 (ribose-2'-O)-methylase SpoU
MNRQATRMPFIALHDIDDQRLESYRHLKHPNRELQDRYFVVEGKLLVERLISSKYPLSSVVTIQRMSGQLPCTIDSSIPIYVVPDGSLSELVGFRFHRGVLACGERLPPPELGELLRVDRTSVILACPQIQDPENLGNLLRSAAALGAAGLLAGPACPDVFSRRVLRVSMGAALQLPVYLSESIENDLVWLASHADYQVWGAVLGQDAEPLARMTAPPRVVLVLGREDQGLPAEILRSCHRRITIPMAPGTDSLNVAMAGTIMLYVLREQQREGPPI